MKQKNIQLTNEQHEFIDNEKKSFDFSQFVGDRLDEYMELKRGMKLEDG